jgi:VWFA-related protein
MRELREEERAVKPGLSASTALVIVLSLGIGLSGVAGAQNQQTPVPDAPTPQAPPPLPGVQGPITPGSGSADTTGSVESSSTPEVAPAAPAPVPAKPAANQTPVKAPPGDEETHTRLVVKVNFVEVPVTVKDAKGKPVPGLTFRDFKVFENNTQQSISFFSVDPQPLSIAFVIDQSLPSNVMDKVNQSLGALQGALAPYDEVAVFTYSHGGKEWTTFTGAQTNRLPAVLALAKSTGTDPTVPFGDSGPFGGCSISQNGACVDPNLQVGGSTGRSDGGITLPKEIHTLNDAILQAARELSSRPKDRRRVIYVVSDGKEYGSKATWKEVVHYLQTNKIAVYGTLVGDSARWGEGWLDRFHLPFEMYDNILYKYTSNTGGDLDSEGGTNGIEKSYAKIADEARSQYTIGYLSDASIYDTRFRTIDVRVDLPSLQVIAKKGYYSSAQDYK